jgi:hypothetical protein
MGELTTIRSRAAPNPRRTAAPSVMRSLSIHRGGHGRVVGDIEPHKFCAQLIGGPLPAVRIARSDPNLMARGDELAGSLEPQSLVRPRYE